MLSGLFPEVCSTGRPQRLPRSQFKERAEGFWSLSAGTGEAAHRLSPSRCTAPDAGQKGGQHHVPALISAIGG